MNLQFGEKYEKLRAEVRAVNHKFLQLKIRLPSELAFLEPEVEEGSGGSAVEAPADFRKARRAASCGNIARMTAEATTSS